MKFIHCTAIKNTKEIHCDTPRGQKKRKKGASTIINSYCQYLYTCIYREREERTYEST